jgi:hypothetical protein
MARRMMELDVACTISLLATVGTVGAKTVTSFPLSI